MRKSAKFLFRTAICWSTRSGEAVRRFVKTENNKLPHLQSSAHTILPTILFALALASNVMVPVACGQTSNPPAGQPDFHHHGIHATGQASKSILDVTRDMMNPHHVDLGAAIAARREQIVENTAARIQFWYSAAATLVILFLIFVIYVLRRDRIMIEWHAAEVLTDFENEVGYARSVAQEATARYNRHMEECNRVIDSQVTGEPQAREVEADELRTLLRKATATEESLKANVEHLQKELNHKNQSYLQLESRLRDVEKAGGHKTAGAPSGAGPAPGGNTGPVIATAAPVDQQLVAKLTETLNANKQKDTEIARQRQENEQLRNQVKDFAAQLKARDVAA